MYRVRFFTVTCDDGTNVAAFRLTLFLLLRTFIDIIALRKGPDSVPASSLVLAIALVMMGVSSYVATMLIGRDAERDYAMTFLGYGLGILFYAAIILISGRARRILQSITSIIGCGSVITVFFAAGFVVCEPLMGREGAAVVATLILLWSVPVEGHIIARAIDQHWFVGVAIAMTAFVLQYVLQSGPAPAQ